SRRQTRARRTREARTPRTRRRSAAEWTAASYVLGAGGEVGEQVEGAGDEHRAAELEGASPRGGRVGDRLDVREDAGRASRQLIGVERASVRGTRRDECVTRTPQSSQHLLRILVREDRRDNRPVEVRQPSEQPLGPRRVVRTVPQLARAAPVEPARNADLDLALERTAEERLRRLVGAARHDLAAGR